MYDLFSSVHVLSSWMALNYTLLEIILFWMLKKLKAPATFGQFNICTLFCPKIKVFHNVYANYLFLCCHNKETNEQSGFFLR